MNAQPTSGLAIRPGSIFGTNGVPRRTPLPAIAPPGRLAGRRAHGRISSGLSFAATMALIAAILAGIFFTYRDDQPAAIPPAQVTATAIASPNAGWPTMLGNNQRTAVTADPGPVGTFAPLWTFKAPGGLNFVIVAGDAAFLQSEDGTLYCLDRTTGQQRWALDTGGAAVGNVRAYPAVDGDTVYAGGRTGDVTAIDVATGAVRWRAHLSAAVEASVLVQDGVVYTGDASGLFVALNAADGSERWHFDDGQGFVNTFPAFDNGMIYVGGPQSVRAIDATTGKLIWETPTDGQVRGAAVADGVVYAPTGAGSVVALAASDGHQLWTRPFPNVGPALSVAVADGTVVAGFDAGGMVGLDAETGKVVWQTPDSGGETTASKVSIADGIAYAYFGPRKGILALDVQTGQERGFAPTAEIRTSPSIVDGVLYAGSGTGIAYAFVTQDGLATPASSAATPASAATAVPAPTGSATAVAASSPLHLVWTATGDDQHRLTSPGTVSVDPEGRLWVSSAPGVFFIFDLDGNLLETWGTPGSGDGQFNFHYEGQGDGGMVAFASDGNFSVADFGNARVEQFDRDRKFVRSIGTKGAGDGQFLAPLSVAYDAQGDLLVSDIVRNDVQTFSPDGAFIRKIGGPGSDPGQFNACGVVTVAPDGSLWVGDIGNHRIQVFHPDGTLSFVFGGQGSGAGKFDMPSQVAFDGAGHAFVTDQNNNLVQVFDLQGRFLYQFGGYGSGDGQFITPQSIAVYRGKTLFVVDYGNNRIQKLAITGPWPTAISMGTPAA